MPTNGGNVGRFPSRFLPWHIEQCAAYDDAPASAAEDATAGFPWSMVAAATGTGECAARTESSPTAATITVELQTLLIFRNSLIPDSLLVTFYPEYDSRSSV